MGFGPFSSDSRTSNRTQNVDNSQTQGAESRAAQFRAGGSPFAAQADAGALAVSGKGNTISISNQVTDHGAVQAGATVLQAALDSQASIATGALEKVTGLAETKVTDGANLTSKNVTLALVVLAALAGLVFLLKRH